MYDENLTLVNSFQAHSGNYDMKQSPFNTDYVGTIGEYDVKIWNASSNANWPLVRLYSAHTSYTTTFAFINEDTVASYGGAGGVFIWSIKTGITNTTINTPATSLQILSNGIDLAVGRYKVIDVYNVNTGRLVLTLNGHKNDVVDLVLFSYNLLASSSLDWIICIWDLTRNTTKFNLTGHANQVYGLELVSSEVLASGSLDFSVILWNLSDGSLMRTLTGHTAIIYLGVSLLEGAQTVLVSGSMDYTIRSWNMSSGLCLKSVNTGMQIRSMTAVNSRATSSLIATSSMLLPLFLSEVIKQKKSNFFGFSTRYYVPRKNVKKL